MTLVTKRTPTELGGRSHVRLLEAFGDEDAVMHARNPHALALSASMLLTQISHATGYFTERFKSD